MPTIASTVRHPEQPLLVVLAPQEPVLGRRRDEAGRRERGGDHDRGEHHPVGRGDPLEALGERHGEQEREQHLHSGKRDAELVEELDELTVLFRLLLLRHSPPLSRQRVYTYSDWLMSNSGNPATLPSSDPARDPTRRSTTGSRRTQRGRDRPRRPRLRAARLLRLRHRDARTSTRWPPAGCATTASTSPRCARRRGPAC